MDRKELFLKVVSLNKDLPGFMTFKDHFLTALQKMFTLGEEREKLFLVDRDFY